MWARQNFTVLFILDNRRTTRRMLKMATFSPTHPGAPGRVLSLERPQLRASPSFHVSRLTFHGSWERGENAAGGLFQHLAKRKGVCIGHESKQRRHHQRSSG
jgi:hypothetical protein